MKDKLDSLIYIGHLSVSVRQGMDLAIYGKDDPDAPYFNHAYVERSVLSEDWFILNHVEDKPEFFPRGKWATIQLIGKLIDSFIATQLEELARKGEKGVNG